MHWAAKRGHVDMIRLLVLYKSLPNRRDSMLRTPLFFAIKYKNIDSAKLLLLAGAKPVDQYFDYVQIAESDQMKKLIKTAKWVKIQFNS